LKIYLTKIGAERLKEEYRKLFHEERPKLVETVAWAASNGDRSENADYQYGKRRLREIDRRLGYLAGRLQDAVIVNPTDVRTTKVVFGATVTLEDENGQERVYQIVGEDELSNGGISWKSPLGVALIGKSAGDEVLITTPTGEKCYSLLKIEYK
jgi:transcription elongation factor GreB